MYEALGISNSNQDFEKSKTIVNSIMKIQPDETKKILMIGELGEITRQQCFIEKNKNNLSKSQSLAQEAMKHFIKYQKAIEHIPVSKIGTLKQKYLIYASMAGGIARHELNDPKTAVLFYDTALEMINDEPNLPNGNFSVGLGYNKAHFLFSKAEALIEMENYEEAELVMDKYGKNIIRNF
ncbi:MAG: hypothetical protein LBJ67_18540 [Planctomycetaceae bacterium]|nr:hypothetical protein [Planctomycetaceae bacterium]